MVKSSEQSATIELVAEDDGRGTARYLNSGVASFGDTGPDTLRELSDALKSHFGRGEQIDDPEAYLESLGIQTDIGEDGSPLWLNRMV